MTAVSTPAPTNARNPQSPKTPVRTPLAFGRKKSSNVPLPAFPLFESPQQRRAEQKQTDCEQNEDAMNGQGDKECESSIDGYSEDENDAADATGGATVAPQLTPTPSKQNPASASAEAQPWSPQNAFAGLSEAITSAAATSVAELQAHVATKKVSSGKDEGRVAVSLNEDYPDEAGAGTTATPVVTGVAARKVERTAAIFGTTSPKVGSKKRSYGEAAEAPAPDSAVASTAGYDSSWMHADLSAKGSSIFRGGGNLSAGAGGGSSGKSRFSFRRWLHRPEDGKEAATMDPRVARLMAPDASAAAGHRRRLVASHRPSSEAQAFFTGSTPQQPWGGVRFSDR